MNKSEKIAFIEHYAKEPRYQGGGSSHIHSSNVVSVLEAAGKENITFVQGFCDKSDETDETLLAEAINAARKSDVAVLFVGLPERYEAEGRDGRLPILRCQGHADIISFWTWTVLYGICLL